MLSVELYDSEISFTSRQERSLRLLENRMLRQIFELKRYEIGEWRGLHNETFHIFYCSPNIIRLKMLED
jgi:hypothetical protein